MRKGIKIALKGHDDPTLEAADEAHRRLRMATIQVPTEVDTSPQDGSPLKWNAETRRFSDASGNSWKADEFAASRPSNRIRKWLDENYPEKK